VNGFKIGPRKTREKDLASRFFEGYDSINCLGEQAMPENLKLAFQATVHTQQWFLLILFFTVLSVSMING
jgi:hypothetical protein